MNNEFNELTIDKVKQIVQKAARPNNLHFTIDRSSAGQNYVEYIEDSLSVDLHIQAVYDSLIRSFLSELREKLYSTNYCVESNSHIYPTGNMFVCDAVIYNIAERSQNHGNFTLH